MTLPCTVCEDHRAGPEMPSSAKEQIMHDSHTLAMQPGDRVALKGNIDPTAVALDVIGVHRYHGLSQEQILRRVGERLNGVDNVIEPMGAYHALHLRNAGDGTQVWIYNRPAVELFELVATTKETA